MVKSSVHPIDVICCLSCIRISLFKCAINCLIELSKIF
nr:MAG TPA: hypothetical protein [Caudoviricetes sp.]